MARISPHQYYRQSVGNNENWKASRQKQKIPFNQQVRNIARQPGLHSGNRNRQNVAQAAISLLTSLTFVHSVPAITPARAKEITLENNNKNALMRYTEYAKYREERDFARHSERNENNFAQKSGRDSARKTGPHSGRENQSELSPLSNAHDAILLNTEQNDKNSINSDLTSSYFNFLPVVNSAPVPKIQNKSGWSDISKSNVINGDNNKMELLKNIGKNLVSSGFLSEDDRNNFEFITGVVSAGEPVIVASLKPSNKSEPGNIEYESFLGNLESNNLNDIACIAEHEVLDARGNPDGRYFLFSTHNSNKKNEIKTGENDKGYSQIVTLGLNPAVGKIITNLKRNEYYSGRHKNRCLNNAESASYAESMARYSNLNERSSPKNSTHQVKPLGLINALPLRERAAFYIRDPLKNIRTEVIFKIHQDAKNNSDANGSLYLKQGGEGDDFHLYRSEGNELKLLNGKVDLNEETLTWKFTDEQKTQTLNVKTIEGHQQIELYGDYYRIHHNGEGNYIASFYNSEGSSVYIPVYFNPLSKAWHISRHGNYPFYNSAQKDILEKISVSMNAKHSYYMQENNNPQYYGKGEIYNAVLRGSDSNYILGRYIEMDGKIIPVRNKHHKGEGVLYEVYDIKKTKKQGYPVEWDGERWLFESQTSRHISDELEKIITPDMYVKNINEGKLSAPDLQGMRSDHENNKYIKINNNFINIKKENSQYFVINKSQNKVCVKYSDGKFYPEKNDLKAEQKVYKRQVKNDCPAWEIQYNELQNIARDNTVVTVRHRGDSDTNIAENSLSAFRLSYKLCRAAIETDVLLTKDNKPVIFHDVRIGKMMEPSYDPDENTGPNAFLKDMSLAELKTKKLLDPRRRVTDDTIITVDEMLDDYLKQGGQSLIYLEVKEPRVILKVAKIITDKASSDPTLLNRVIVKFNMAEFPTYIDWVAGLRNVDASVNIMANPVMSPAAAERINKLPAGDIPIPEGDPLHDNASRAVYWWSSTPGISVPNVEVVLKSTDSGFINKVRRPSPQGYYEQPISLDMANTIPGTPAYMIAIVKKNGKSLGTYVPVADRIMWRDGFVAGVTVPDTKNPKKRNDITESYYNNDSSCCYTLEDRLAENEKEDVRENVAWNRGIGANIITSDDIDSIDTYAADMNYLDKKALPVTHYPKKEMQSTLAWGMNYWPKPDGAKVVFQGWGGASSQFLWGGQVCLWDNKFTRYPWVFQCDASPRSDYRNELLMTVVKSDTYGAVNQIFSHDKKYCLSGKDGDYSYMKYIEDCRAENTETHFWYTPHRHLRNLYKEEDVSYVQFYRSGVYDGLAYGLLQNTKTPGSWAEWKMKQVG